MDGFIKKLEELSKMEESKVSEIAIIRRSHDNLESELKNKEQELKIQVESDATSNTESTYSKTTANDIMQLKEKINSYKSVLKDKSVELSGIRHKVEETLSMQEVDKRQSIESAVIKKAKESEEEFRKLFTVMFYAKTLELGVPYTLTFENMFPKLINRQRLLSDIRKLQGGIDI